MHYSHLKPVQLHLFARPDGCDPPSEPPWQSLPCRTRRRATVLMTQLFLEPVKNPADDTEADSVAAGGGKQLVQSFHDRARQR